MVEARSWRTLDGRLIATLLMGSVALALEVALRRRQLPNPLPELRIPRFSESMFVAYLLVPGVASLLLWQKPWQYFRLGNYRAVWKPLASFVVIVLASTAWLATFDSWQDHYSAWGWAEVRKFALGAFLTMICGEFFFRGFLLFPLYDRFGGYALPMVVMPYTVIHAGKPVGELFGSIVFGLGLSYLAVRSRSIWYSVGLHWLLAILIPAWIAIFRD